MPSLRRLQRIASLLSLLGTVLAGLCIAQSGENFTCAANRTYRNIQHANDQGREEYCDLELPGGLIVKDGPYRSWLSPQGAPTTGQYHLGREVGKWTDCNRFNHCSSTTYEEPFLEERKRAAYKPRIPVQFEQGKYSFDFASCRSTWITKRSGPEEVSLNIGGGSPYRCVISWVPQHFLERGGAGGYTCFIPYSLGTRSFASLDLMKEFPRAGLPQFCRPERTTPEPLMIREGIYEVAYSTDVQCASLNPSNDGKAELAIQLNPIAADLVMQTAAARGPLNTLLCSDPIEGPKIAHDRHGTLTFLLRLSGEKAKARRQEKCAREILQTVAGCSSGEPRSIH